MFEIAADRRRIETEPDAGGHARIVELGRRFVEVRVELARALVRVETVKAYVAYDCASIEEYGARYVGISARDAREIVDLGHALDVASPAASAHDVGDIAGGGSPCEGVAAAPGAPVPVARDVSTVADAVRSGVLSIERAAAVGRMVKTPGLLRDGEDPVALALAGSMREVRTMIRVREEEMAQEDAVVPIGLAVTARARDGFRRARSIASERAGAMLTEGETFSVVVEHYVESFDPSRVGEGSRRLIDTSELPGQRYVPVSVRRAVRRRSGEQCEVPGCPHRTFLEFAHVEPHRVGGSREECNLVHLCGRHHVLLDAGRIQVSSMEGGCPRFCDARRRPLADTVASPTDGGVDASHASGAAADAGAAENRSDDHGAPGGDAASPGSSPQDWFGDDPDLGDEGAGQVAERPPPYGYACPARPLRAADGASRPPPQGRSEGCAGVSLRRKHRDRPPPTDAATRGWVAGR